MIEVRKHRGLVVTIRTDADCVGANRDQHMGYEITIESDAPTVRITGCHDSSPDFVDEFSTTEPR